MRFNFTCEVLLQNLAQVFINSKRFAYIRLYIDDVGVRGFTMNFLVGSINFYT